MLTNSIVDGKNALDNVLAEIAKTEAIINS